MPVEFSVCPKKAKIFAYTLWRQTMCLPSYSMEHLIMQPPLFVCSGCKWTVQGWVNKSDWPNGWLYVGWMRRLIHLMDEAIFIDKLKYGAAGLVWLLTQGYK